MRALILIGVKKTSTGLVPVNLYTGLDGAALMKAASEAVAQTDVEWVSMHRMTNPATSPMPIMAGEVKTSTPTFVRPKPTSYWNIPTQETPFEKVERKAAELRKAQLNSPKLDKEGKFTPEVVKLPPGPTLEDFTAAGYPADAYPPHGYSEVSSPALDLYKAGKAAGTAPSGSDSAQTPSTPPPTGDVTPNPDQGGAAAPGQGEPDAAKTKTKK